jgi:hypothetical protein
LIAQGAVAANLTGMSDAHQDGGTRPAESWLFVSHVDEDRAVAMDIVTELERRGLKCWIAPRDVIQSDYAKALTEAIDACRAFLVIFSAKCNDSSFIRREVTVASNAGKTIIPLRIEDAPLRGGLRIWLEDVHWIKAFPVPVAAIGELERRLKPQTRSVPGSVREPDPKITEQQQLPRPTPEPERKVEQRPQAEQNRPTPRMTSGSSRRSLSSVRPPFAVLVLCAAVLAGVAIWFSYDPIRKASLQPDLTTWKSVRPDFAYCYQLESGLPGNYRFWVRCHASNALCTQARQESSGTRKTPCSLLTGLLASSEWQSSVYSESYGSWYTNSSTEFKAPLPGF